MNSDSPRKSIYRPHPIGGFPDLLPEWRAVEQRWLDRVRDTFESFGFCGIETPVVEELDALRTKAEIDKEIYVLERLHAEEGDEARLAMHYDLTVPFARYTAQHFNDLVFPFKRYQMQKCWRGERPQLGREREFMQCDVDVINVDSLSLHFDAELPVMILTALEAMEVRGMRLHISNRKILQGYLMELGFADPVSAIRWIDKGDKVPEADIVAQLTALCGDPAKAAKAVEIGKIRTVDSSFSDRVRALGVRNDVLDAGLEELAFVMDRLKHLPEGSAVADLSIARGFDYYTGTVYEGKLIDHPGTSTIAAGGRYEDLAGSFINKKLPGVGISLGITRLFEYLRHFEKISPGPRSPADVLVILWSEDLRPATEALSTMLRRRGVKVEMYHAPQKISRQMSYAEKKNIPYVWFPPQEPGQPHEVKTMATGEQTVAEVESWNGTARSLHHSRV
jgi:histidyl-tRNA synthetase